MINSVRVAKGSVVSFLCEEQMLVAVEIIIFREYLLELIAYNLTD